MADNDKFGSTSFEDDDDQSGEGGQSSQIKFHDFIGTGSERKLPFMEEKRLLLVHSETNELLIKKQKEAKEQRAAVKEGKISVQAYRQGLGQGQGGSNYKSHPTLANKAQFSGDTKVNPQPDVNNGITNEAERSENENQNRLRNQLRHTPKFNPQLRPPGG